MYKESEILFRGLGKKLGISHWDLDYITKTDGNTKCLTYVYGPSVGSQFQEGYKLKGYNAFNLEKGHHPKFLNDINKSIKIFKKKIGYNPIFFSYPFGEYNLEQKNYIKKKFKLSFGQHSGVIDVNKDKFELPRFPINEKYGDLKRFEFLINFLPFQYKDISPEEKFIKVNKNPPELKISFFEGQENLKNITCYSNEGNEWEKSNINISDNILKINFREKFLFRRGRVNCSLNDDKGWRWFGIQFTIEQLK